MDIIKYGLLILLSLIRYSTCLMQLSSSNGCTRLLNPTCIYEVFCTNYIEQYIDTYAYSCNKEGDHGIQFQSNYYGYSTYHRIYLKYKNTMSVDQHLIIPQARHTNNGYRSEFWYPLIVRLDLSYNDFSITPSLEEMQNLAFLNLSNNFITVAKLWNSNNLPSLNEIDLSFNTIASIEVGQTHNGYANLEKLNLSHNYFVDLPDLIFDRFAKLDTLDLSHNYIDTLSISTFEGIKRLTRLFLSYNRLADLNYSLFRFSELTVLDLSHNRIENLMTHDFEKLTKLEEIDLSSNSILNLERCTFCSMTYLKSINLHDNKLSTLNKETFANASSLNTVDISSNNFNVLPRGLFKGKNIHIFNINGNHLKDPLVQGMFEGLGLVTQLDLSYQFLTSIEDYSFFGLNSIDTLLLNNNQIKSLSKNCFKSLESLKTLDLSSNNITSLNFSSEGLINLNSIVLKNNFLTQIKHDDFLGLNMLQFLDLKNNRISSIESNAFNSLRDLINFEISQNPLNGRLEEKTFNGLNSLPSLDISFTQLTAVENGSFIGLMQLKELNMSHSKISELQYNAFVQTGAIEVLDLSDNQLRTFDVNATDLASISVLYLNKNLLKSITASSLLGLSHLNKINLAYNDIKTIPNGTFNEQNDLAFLDLSYNLEIEFDVAFISTNLNLNNLYLSGLRKSITFTSLGNAQLSYLEISYSGIANVTQLNLKILLGLESITLSNNNITKLEVGAFTNLTKLTRLDISCNKIYFIQPGVFKDNERLRLLNISHNSIIAVSYGIFRGLNVLDTLDMSFNNINSLENERFYEVRNLRTLIVDNNKIDTINAEYFAGTILSTLSIGENPLPCEILVNFKSQRISFVVTAINLNEHSGENVDGVTCNMNGFTLKNKSNKSKTDESEKLLIDIKELLVKIANKNKGDEHYVSKDNSVQYVNNVTNQIEFFSNNIKNLTASLSNSTLLMVAQSNSTNIILTKILNAINRKPVANTTPFPMSNDNNTNNMILYINKMKSELEDIIATEKENILNEVEKKVSDFQSPNHISTPLPNAPIQDKLLRSGESFEGNKSKFTETCVALILAILVCLVLYKFYKSRLFVRTRRSYSTRELPGAMESPNL